LWEALTKDRRFAHHGFKRQTPVGRHIPDLVSFPLRLVIELKAADETEVADKTRSERRTWLTERGYRVMEFTASEIETDVSKVLNQIAADVSRRA
jgi:tRNA/rRNA methyltransferase